MDGSVPAPPRTKVTAEAVRARKAELGQAEPGAQQAAAAWFRGVLRLPDELKQNCVDEIVELMPRFVELLSSDHQGVVTEAASVVANIAASPGEHSSTRVIESGAVPLLIKLLGSTENNDLKDHAALALGNVAIGSAQARNHVIDSGGLEPLMNVMNDFVEGQSTSARVLNSTVWTVSQLCRAVPRPSVEVLRPVLPVLTQLLVTAGDEEVLVDACWAISYLAEDFAYLEVVCQPEIVKVVVNLLDHPSNGVRTAAVRASGNFVTGNDRQTQVVIEAGGLEAFGKLIESPVDEHCKDAVWAISNIAAGTQEQIQRVIDANLIPKLVRAWHTRCETVKTEAAWALCNFCTGGSPEQFKYLMSQRHAVTPLVCVLLESKDTALASGARNAIDALTKAGEAERQRNSAEQNDYARAVEDAQKARTAFMRAQRFESDKNWNAAIESYTEAMRHYWNPEKCHNRMGICYSKLGQHDEAFSEYDSVLKINPHDGVGYCNRGRKHLALGRFAEAEADALMSLKLNPKHKTSQQLLLDARKKTIAQDLPGTEAELYSQAEKLRKHKQWSAAIDAFTELLETDYPGKAHLLNQRGVCYQELGQHEDALRDLTESLDLDPSQPVSKLCNRADVFRDLERFDEAIADLNRVIEMAPDDGAAKAQLAEVHTARAVPAIARTAFKNAKKKYNADHWDDAVAGFTDAISSGLGKSETYSAWVMRGWCYHRIGKMDDSLRDFDMAVADDPTRVVGWYSRGIAHKRGGRAHQAKEDCDHAVDLTWEDLARASLEDFGLPPLGVEEQMCDVPEGIRVFFTQLAGAVIGDEMFGMRCFEAAVSAYSLALRSTANATLVVPRDALCRWHFQRGRCYLLLQRNAEAMSDFTTVISKVPENKPKLADAHFFRGHLYNQQDKWLEAEQDLQVCLKLKPGHETAGELLKSTQEKLSSRARNAEEAEKELLAQLDKDQEREKKKREKNKLKKQRQKGKKKKEPSGADSDEGAATAAANEPDTLNSSVAAATAKELMSKGVSSAAKKPPAYGESAPERRTSAKSTDMAHPLAAAQQASVSDDSARTTHIDSTEQNTGGDMPVSQSAKQQQDSSHKKRRGGRATEAPAPSVGGGSASASDRQQNRCAAVSTAAGPTTSTAAPAPALMDEDCPLCCEPFDATDLAFTPCPCGYKVCVWCYHRLRDTDGQCPACRQGYSEVEQKVVKVSKRAPQDKDSADRRPPTSSKSEPAEETWMRRLFAATEGGLRQSELDMTVVDLLRKLEPTLWEPAIEKIRSVTTWATIRNKSGFVTAEMQKLRANWNQQHTQHHAVQRDYREQGNAGSTAPTESAASPSIDAPPTPSAVSPVASSHGNGRSTWAAAVRPGEVREVREVREQRESEPVQTDFPAHALVARLSKELAAIPGGKNTRRERKRLTQRLYDAERTDAYVAESKAMAGNASRRGTSIINGGLLSHVRECVRAQYGARTTTVSSRFVTLASDGQNGQRAPLSVVRPLLYDGSLLTIVRIPDCQFSWFGTRSSSKRPCLCRLGPFLILLWLRVLQDHSQFDGAPVANFLHAFGMGEYSVSFAEAEIDLEALQLLDEADLTDLGISTPTGRQKLLRGVAELRETLSG